MVQATPVVQHAGQMLARNAEFGTHTKAVYYYHKGVGEVGIS